MTERAHEKAGGGVSDRDAIHSFVEALSEEAGAGVLDYWWGVAAERLYHEGWRVTPPTEETEQTGIGTEVEDDPESPAQAESQAGASDSSASDEEAKSEAEPVPPPDDLDARVLDVLRSSPSLLGRGAIAEGLEANPHTISDVLARLVATGRAERVGERAGTRYRLPRSDESDPDGASKSCRVTTCIMAAKPGGEYCEQHAEDLARVERAGLVAG